MAFHFLSSLLSFVFTGPYVVNFDGKEDAVINALSATLQPVDPIAINITSYTVGAPVCTFYKVPPTVHVCKSL